MSPAVSVITVCRDARAGLLRTRESVLAQTCRDFEWIIVDGASADGTRELLGQLDAPWVRWVSEPDAGIYDAMNKGLRMARGGRVWFLNAGDTFHDAGSLGAVAAVPDTVDICYGEAIVMGPGWRELGPRSRVTPHRLPDSLDKSLFRFGMVVSHQPFVPRRAIAPLYQSERYMFSADLDWMLAILARPRSSANLGPLARIEREGATLRNWRRSQWERFLILARHFGAVPAAPTPGSCGGALRTP